MTLIPVGTMQVLAETTPVVEEMMLAVKTTVEIPATATSTATAT